MSSDIAIRVAGLGKSYRIQQREQQITLAEQALQRLRKPFARSKSETFWALSDLDLEVRRGEVLGLIGRNGAGKSTFLKTLSRITAPTTGRIDLYGRVGSLLEVGTGFHPELTGRENIFLNGSILGMRRPEIERQFDDIVEFAGVERFLDTPVKRYSSGMYVRLAFAVAAHLETEILLVDEVLAVGDHEFQEKCLGKMRDVTTQGRTVILVSHNLTSVRQLADRCVLLDKGRVAADGPADSVLTRYRELASAPWMGRDRPKNSVGRPAAITRLELQSSQTLLCGQPVVLELDTEINAEHATRLAVGVTLRSGGTAVGASLNIVSLPATGSQMCTCTVELDVGALAPGQFSISVGVGALGDRESAAADHVVEDALWFELVPSPSSNWLLRNWQPTHGYVPIKSTTSPRASESSK